ncbi:MAG: hypothetical protein MN733_20100, partial [Nitrososphaera sp.]|nr:hypothetical protein [Nitrososphaera sp.]
LVGLTKWRLPYLRENLSEMVRIAHAAGKLLIVSIAEFSPEGFGSLASAVYELGPDLVELNLGCPNVWAEGTQKPIFSYDPDLVEAVLVMVEASIGKDMAVAVKLSPLPPSILDEVAAVIEFFSFVKVVVATNTWPNAFAWSKGKQAIDVGEGLAGMAGPALKPISLGVVKQLNSLFAHTGNIDLIGVGGISTQSDALDYFRIGPQVKAVQIATAYNNEGSKVFDRVERGLEQAVSLLSR